MITFRVICVPVAQPRPRAGLVFAPAKSPGAFLHKGRWWRVGIVQDIRHAVHGFKQALRLETGRHFAGRAPLTGPLHVTLHIGLPRPQAKIWKTKPMPKEWHESKPDADNYAKAIQDALTGILWIDDAQVVELHVAKYVVAGDEEPGVLVHVEPVPEEVDFT